MHPAALFVRGVGSSEPHAEEPKPEAAPDPIEGEGEKHSKPWWKIW